MVRGRNQKGQKKAIATKKKLKRVPFSNAGISKLPKHPGMYTINAEGEKYIGHTKNLHQRLKQHKRNGNTGNSISYKQTVTKQQASSLEKKRIRGTCPSRNTIKPNSCKGFFERNFGIRI